ncbi:bifunctional DNA primase/polymerase [Planomonospora sp. ID82291]|uniref:bifunctional DNA primase/polymerase n=1 Tax=Planomonospora sp. ID82291 TaxID=2738136 RepID=UPI0018C3D0B1|nr:bifunctional DNA primase/polymerase [Planomonospora sp. ID82291]MBG0818580.1 bifunctional DNA primase/polymerase [Planomonospora sp. ID82291]
MTPPDEARHPQAGRDRPVAVARWCAARGWPVHPLAPGRKTPAGNCRRCQGSGHPPASCACPAAGRWCHGFHAATTDPGLIASWWTANPAFGVGVACGPADLVVIDVDAHPAAVPGRDRVLPGIPIPERVDLTGLATGFHALALLAALRGAPDPAQDAATLRVRTPSGGMHVWYRAEGAGPFLCSVGSAPGSGRALAWQVDVRAGGGYIIAPGTRTGDGLYTPLGDCRVPAPLPEWLAGELVRTGHRPEPSRRTGPSPAPMAPPRGRQAVARAGGGRTGAARALDRVLDEVLACAAVPEGAGFTAKLNVAAYTAGGLVAAGHLVQAEAERLLTDAATRARPGQTRRCEQIIRTGLAAGARRPLHIEGRPTTVPGAERRGLHAEGNR